MERNTRALSVMIYDNVDIFSRSVFMIRGHFLSSCHATRTFYLLPFEIIIIFSEIDMTLLVF